MGEEPDKIIPAINEIDEGAKTGERPYEMARAGRREERRPLVDFEDMSGWTVETYAGAKAEIRRSREQQMWGSFVAKAAFSGSGPESRFILRPPSPVPVDGEFDCVNLWVYGNNWGWEQPDENNPRVEITALFQGSNGAIYRVSLTNVRWKEWWLMHKRIDERTLSGIRFPCVFTGIEVRGCLNKKKSLVYFDSLSFYKEELKPLAFEPRPRRNLEPRPGQDIGTNRGPGTLPFPVRKETILPSNLENSFSNEARETQKNEFTFEYKGKDAGIKYVYTPAGGTFDEICVYVNNKKICRPMAEGGIRFENGAEREQMSLRSAEISNGIVTAVFSSDRGGVQYRLWIWQKSLVIEVSSPGGKATGLSVGCADGLEGPRLVRVPFLCFDGSFPQVLMLEGKDPLFVSCWVDWYNSNASELYFETWAKKDSARFNGGTRYIAKTDGKRNGLFERLFLTVSPEFEEVLPTIDNPPAPLGKTAGEYLYRMGWLNGVGSRKDFDREHEVSKKNLWSYGIRKLMKLSHEDTWRDGGEAFTLRTSTSPKKTDEGLKEFTAKQNSLGWKYGFYSNYTDYGPVNEYWDEDKAARQPDNDWRPAWPRCYNLKPSRAVEFDAKLAAIVKKKFDSMCSYTDVHTAVAPWYYTDYDARVPGAGTFAATFYAYGELLRNDQLTYGPTFSEGRCHWIFAGLPTGNYAQDPTYDFYAGPLNVAFDLLKMHPLQTDIGMGYQVSLQFAKRSDARYPDEHIDRFIAATIAYGHIGLLIEGEGDRRQVCRSYYMVQQIAKRYSLEKAGKIEYADEDNRWFNVSQAIARKIIKESRLHVEYENGLNIFVNWSRDRNWPLPSGSVKAGGETILLPPSGWCAFDNKGFFEASRLKDGYHIDEVVSSEYLYLDGRNKWTENGYLAAKGGAALITAEGKTELINIENSEIGFKVSGPVACTALDYNGEPKEKVEARYSRGYAFIPCSKSVHSYLIEKAASGFSLSEKEPNFSLEFPVFKAAPGDSASAKIKFKAPSAMKITGLVIGLENGDTVRVKPLKTSLEKGEKYEQVIAVNVPSEISPENHIWFEARLTAKTGSNEEEYTSSADLYTIPALVIEPEKREVVFKSGKAKMVLLLENNLQGDPEGKAVFSLENDVLSADPEEIDIPQGPKQKITVNIVQKKQAEVKKASLDMSAEINGVTVEKTFRIKAGYSQPVITDFPNGSFSFVWTTAVRGKEEEQGSDRSGASFMCQKDMSVGGKKKNGFFSHPPYNKGVGYTSALFEAVKLPEEPAEFHMFIGLMDGGDPSDGVDYSVIAMTKDGGSVEVLKEHGEQKEWKEVSADLSEFAGKEVQFRLAADVGPGNNPSADWACWGEPVIRVKEKKMILTIESK